MDYKKKLKLNDIFPNGLYGVGLFDYLNINNIDIKKMNIFFFSQYGDRYATEFMLHSLLNPVTYGDDVYVLNRNGKTYYISQDNLVALLDAIGYIYESKWNYLLRDPALFETEEVEIIDHTQDQFPEQKRVNTEATGPNHGSTTTNYNYALDTVDPSIPNPTSKADEKETIDITNTNTTSMNGTKHYITKKSKTLSKLDALLKSKDLTIEWMNVLKTICNDIADIIGLQVYC